MNVRSSATLGHLLTGVGILVAMLLGASGMVYTSYAKGQEKQDECITDNTRKIEKNTESLGGVKVDIGKIQSDVEHIRDNLDWMRKNWKR